MKSVIKCTVAAMVLCSASVVMACGDYGKYSPRILKQLAASALSADPEVANPAIESLRRAGPKGLEALLALVNEPAVAPSAAQQAQPPAQVDVAVDDGYTERLEAAIDAVGGQKYCQASRLYWYTDFEAARAEAARTGRPILSLRLLGKLTDEKSCANSRFFRTALYANEEISKALRENYVLHWKSVRPAPTITIDFGDGRKLERTITGNSIHYLMTSDGRVFDAIPGLHGPQAFLQEIGQGTALAAQLHSLENESQRTQVIRRRHSARLSSMAKQWWRDLQQLGIAVADEAFSGLPCSRSVQEFSEFSESHGKCIAALEAATNEEVWTKIAELHQQDARLDESSVALMENKFPAAPAAGRRAFGKMAVENPMLRLVAEFQRNMALDTVKNQYQLRRQLLTWLATEEIPEVDTLNDRVYAQLFLTPNEDPWLGLVNPKVFSALPYDGVVVTAD